jgi:hypothetical protein
MSRFLSLVPALAFTLAGLGLFGAPPASAAGTAPGTAINNTATAQYSDGTTTYSVQSNTVTVTVQNAAALTVAPPSTSPGTNVISPGGTLTDTFTLTNAGNASGYFQLTGTQGVDDGVTSGAGTFGNYVVNVPGQTQQTFTTIAAVNSYLSAGNSGGPFLTAVGSTITIGVQYAATSAATGTITTKVTATITQPALTSPAVPASTSSSQVGQYNDTVTADARLDLQKTAVVGGTASAPTVAYTVNVNNGGGRAVVAVKANALPSGLAALGDGVIVTDKIPSYNATQLTLNGTPTFVRQPTGAQFVYSTNGTSWTTTSTGAVYVGVFIPATAITGTFGASNPGSSQGSVTPAQAQLAFTYTINGSTANGSANSNAITNVVNSAYGDQSGFIEGPGIPFQSIVNNTSAVPATSTQLAINNTNGALTGSTSTTSAASPSSASVLNGPNGAPGATGKTSTNDDYTAISYTDGGTLKAATNGGSSISVPSGANAVTFTNSIQNGGNKDDTFALTSGVLASNLNGQPLPAGWTVVFKSTGQTASGSCPAVTAGTTITSICVTSGSTATYTVALTPPASATTFTPFTPYGVSITATSGVDNTKTNVTNDEFFVAGYVNITKTVGVASGQPCATATTFVTATTVNPKDCVQYTVTYANVMPTGGTGSLALSASSLVITENGAATGSTNGTAYTNSWAANSGGLFAAPVDSLGGTIAGGTVGSTSFTDTLTTLAPGATGTLTFKVQIT